VRLPYPKSFALYLLEKVQNIYNTNLQ